MKDSSPMILSVSTMEDIDKLKELSNVKYINIDLTNPNLEVIYYLIDNGQDYSYSDMIDNINGYIYVSYDIFKQSQLFILDIINNVQIYTFNYKQSNTPSIGLIAQDLMDKTLNGFNFIDNLDATGENDDYMSVHESKLVYILWKAVQELSAEVNELKKQLNK